MAGEGGIARVCVVGAGTMGAGIAAQIANAGVPVLLLDVVRDEARRSGIAEDAIARLLAAEPAAFMEKRAARLIAAGNIEDHLAEAAQCDWVIEAIVERLDLKQALYARLEPLLKPDAAISSNTSTMPLARLVDGRGAAFRRSFLITHFFNPPRYMRLLELVAGPETDPALAERIADFADRALGKSVVRAHDTPGFIANRIGTFWLQTGVNAAFDLGLTVEEADAIAGRPMGVPKTGIFGLIDLVGIDLMPLLQKSMTATLPEGDAFHAAARPQALIEKMIADGFTGRKGKGGFYRLNRERGGKVKEAIDLATGAYRAEARPAALPGPAARGDLAALLALPGKAGAYAWAVLGPTLAYAAGLVPEAADDIVALYRAMQLGYNWKYGPVELIDRIGAAAFAKRLEAAGLPVPPLVRLAGERSFYRVEGGRRQHLGGDGAYHDVVRPDGVLLLEDVKRAAAPLLRNRSAALWDVGDGVACLEFTAKMNALDDAVLKLIGEAVPLVAQRFKALLIYNEGSNFSAGANLGLALFAVNIAAFGEVEKLVAGGQMAMKVLKYAPFPVVAAPAGMALGGGCETCLHADAIQAHAEAYMGLVETGVGIVPGWGGCGEMLDRWQKAGTLPRGPMPAVARVFEIVSVATVSKSAAEACALGILRPQDGITMNRDRLLADAKARALAMVEGYTPPAPPSFHLPGPSGRTALALAAHGFHRRGLATDYDLIVSDALATVLTGGETDPLDALDEGALLALEREQLMRRIRDPRTMARIETMLETGKPLRN